MPEKILSPREKFWNAAVALGWTPDKYGHLQAQQPVADRTPPHRTYRLKFAKTTVRLEVLRKIGKKNEWLRMTGRDFRHIAYLGDGRVVLGSLTMHKLQ